MDGFPFSEKKMEDRGSSKMVFLEDGRSSARMGGSSFFPASNNEESLSIFVFRSEETSTSLWEI